MIISTDSCANLPKEKYEELGIPMIPMQILLNNKIYDDLSEELPNKQYYQKMREGAIPTTAQINEFSAKQYFEKLLSSGEDVLHISFSSALSGTTATMLRLMEELNQQYKNKLVVIDSLNASMGQGLLVLLAYDLMKQGKDFETICNTVKDNLNRSCSYFTVDNLKYLVRGGRVSKFSGFVGNLLKIKPILHVDENGHLVPFKKVISRGKSISTLAEICAQNIEDKSIVYISHADSEQDAQKLSNEIKQKLDVSPIIVDITQVIGCHTGPGLLAVFFFGQPK